MPPNHFESEVESFLEGSHGDRTHIKRADHHTVTPLCGTLLEKPPLREVLWGAVKYSSPRHAEKCSILPILSEQGRYFFH